MGRYYINQQMAKKRGVTKLRSKSSKELSGPDHVYRQLAASIVTQAILDWCHAYDTLKKNPKSRKAKKMKESAEEFFSSSEPENLCGIKGSDIYNRILEAKVYGEKNEIEKCFNKIYVDFKYVS